MKRLIALFLTLLMLLSLCACGESSTPPAQNQSSEPIADEPTKDENLTPLEPEYFTSAITDDLMSHGISSLTMRHVKQGHLSDEGNYTYSFSLCGEDCSYVIDAFTGEIKERNLPDIIMNNIDSIRDYASDALAVILNFIEYNNGSLENTGAKVTYHDDETVVYRQYFDYNSQHYDYDVTFLPGYYYYNDEIPANSKKSEHADIPEEYADMPALELSAILEIVSNDLIALGTSLAADMKDFKMSDPDSNANRTITFKLSGIDCMYLINAYNGDVIDKNVPEEAISSARDYFGESVNAAVHEIATNGNQPENIRCGKRPGPDGSTIITVDLDYQGEHYSREYTYPKNSLEAAIDDAVHGGKSDEEYIDEALQAAYSLIPDYDGSASDVTSEVKLIRDRIFVFICFNSKDTSYDLIYVPSVKGFLKEN